ncbi:MAG: PAS domain S-box protein [Methanolinea sp.]|nr:PAS domain S-box protein [Methanolinea sp.]
MISVLLVDDEPALLDVTQIFLERDGKMQVTLSESAKDALQKLEKGHFDIIVADYEMPQMNGIDFLREVKASGYDLPFIIFTGRGREHVAIEALNLGASFYLQKGGDPKSQFAELRNMIVQAVQKKHAEEEVRANQVRLQAVIDLYQRAGDETHDLCMFALDKAIAISGSRIGFLAFVNEQETTLTMYAWSPSALEICSVRERRTEYPLEKTGLWGDPVRQRRAIITNDYSGNVPGKKGYPEGHPPLTRYLGVPILDGSRVVMVIGLANKESDYTGNDVQQVTLLMGSLWQVLSRKRTESELIASEKRFRSYFELPLAGIAIATPDLRWIQVNQKFCQMLGYTAGELGTLSWTDLTPAEDREGEKERLSRVISGKEQSLTLEKKFQRKDGSLLEVEVSAMPVRKVTGEVDYFVALINDISDLKRTERELLASNEQMSATLEELRVTQDSLNEYCHRLEREEKALRQSETRFRTMVESAPSLLLILDRDGRVSYASPHSASFTGYTPGELQDIAFDFIHPDDAPRVRSLVLRSIQEGAGFRNVEFRARKKDGVTWCASGSMEPLRDEKGEISGFIVQVVDISPQKEAERALRQSEERTREILETINDVVFSLDGEGKIVYTSPAVTRALGYSPGDLSGRSFTELLLPEDVTEAVQGYAAFRTGQVTGPLDLEWRVLSRSGDTRWCRLSLRPIEKDGHFAGCTGTITDIHDKKTAIETLKERETLLQGIFRATPLGIGLVRDRVLLYVNDSVCRMTGYSRDDLVGKSSRLLYPSDEEFRRVGEEMGSRMWETGGETVESRWVRKDGSLIEVQISTSPLDPADHASPVVFSVRDITADREIMATLYEKEHLLQEFFDAFPEPAFLVAQGGEVIMANAAFSKRYGVSLSLTGGTCAYSLVDPDGRKSLGSIVESALQSGNPDRFMAVEGGRSLSYTVFPIRGPSGVASRAAVFSFDVTDQEKERRALALDTRKLSLLGSVVCHDAGSLVGALWKYLGLMKDKTGDPLLLTYIRKQERNLGALAGLLSLAEVYIAPRMRSPAWQDVSSTIRKVAEMHDLRDVTVFLDCEGLMVRADPLLGVVFSQLVENALRHGDRVSKISFSYREEGEDLILVCEDDGPGISPDRKEAIFGAGEGGVPASGLSLAREILALFGFIIRETGEEGHGARFEIVVPAGAFRIGK